MKRKALSIDDFDKEEQGSGRFLKVEAGKSVVVVTVLSPLEAPTGLSRVEKDFDGTVSVRYQMKVWNVGERRLQIWEAAYRWAQMMVSQVKEHGWGVWQYRISREGASVKTTRYTITPTQPVSPEMAAAISAAVKDNDFPLNNDDAEEDVDPSVASKDLPF